MECVERMGVTAAGLNVFKQSKTFVLMFQICNKELLTALF